METTTHKTGPTTADTYSYSVTPRINTDRRYDVALARHELEMLSDAGILQTLRAMFPTLDLYSVSVDWRNLDLGIHTIKARGAAGDVLAEVLEVRL